MHISMALGFAWRGLTGFKRREARLLAGGSRAGAQHAPDLAPAAECHQAQIVRFRYQKWESASVHPVLVIWLIFYAIAIVGAVTGPLQVAETPEMVVVVDGAHKSGLR